MNNKKTPLGFILIATIAVTSCVWKYNDESDFKVEHEGNGIIIIKYLDSKQKKVRIPPRIQNLPVTSIGRGAFSGCYSLAGVTIPSSVTNIGDWAFGNCANLTEIKVAADNTAYTAEKGVLYNKNKTILITCPMKKTNDSFTIPNSVTSIGDNAFSNCTSLASVTMPSSVTSIGYGAFSNCTSLVNITIPDSVTSIGMYAFAWCTSLTSITIPDSVTSIGKDAFFGCESLKNITIKTDKITFSSLSSNWGSIFPASGLSVTFEDVTSIGDYAFYGCRRLASVTIPNSVTSIGKDAFSGLNIPSITIPNSVTSIGDYAFSGCINLAEIKAAAGNSAYIAEDGVLYNKNKTFLHTYPAGKTDVSFNIPNSVTHIGNGAFTNCANLTSVTMPDSVTIIGDRAFSDCWNLTRITIPDSVTSIGKWAFGDCLRLTSVTIPDSVTSIGYSAFQNCTSLTSVTFQDTIPSSGFDSDAFDGGLRDKFYEKDEDNGTPGIYTREREEGSTWTKQYMWNGE